MRAVASARQGARAASSARSRRSCRRRSRSLPNLPDPSAAPGPEDELVREVGDVPPLDFAPRDHLELAGELIDMDRAATPVGLALRLSERRPRDARAGARALGAREAARARLRAGDPAGARARAGAVRDRLPARHRAADLPRCPRTSCSSSAPPRSRSPRCTTARSSTPSACRCATPASRRASAARPARPARTRAGIFRVHQFDKVEMFSFVAPEESAAEHERILAIEEEILGELELPYRVVNIAVDDLGNSAAKKYDCEAWLPEPGPLPRADLVLEHDRLPGAAPEHPRAPRASARRRCTRSTAPRSRSGARSSRCSRTASGRTAASSCRRRSSPTARRRG